VSVSLGTIHNLLQSAARQAGVIKACSAERNRKVA